MKPITFDNQKNELIKRERGLFFEEIILLLQEQTIIDIIENPTHEGQEMFIIEINQYAVVIPFVEYDDHIELKTAFYSRKYTKKYGLKNG